MLDKTDASDASAEVVNSQFNNQIDNQNNNQTISVVHPPQYEGPEPAAEDFLPMPKRVPSVFEKMPRQGSAFPGAVLFALMTIASMLRWNHPDFTRMFEITRVSLLERHEHWRLFTALMGHGDMAHLLHNLPVFLFFAWILHGYFGLLASVVAPLMIGAISNAITVYFYDDHVRLLGASGMIYGMAALWLVLYVQFDRKNWWVKRIMRAVGFSLLVLFPQTYDPKISYLAHLSGFVCGLVIGGMMVPYMKKWSPVAILEREARERLI